MKKVLPPTPVSVPVMKRVLAAGCELGKMRTGNHSQPRFTRIPRMGKEKMNEATDEQGVRPGSSIQT